MNIDPRRDFIWQELHARPYVRFDAPAHVFHFSFLSEEGTEAADHAALDRVATAMKLKATYETERHSIYAAAISGIGRVAMSWERHGEFVAYTFFVYELAVPFRPFGLDPWTVLPDGFREQIGLPLLVAVCLTIGPKKKMPATPEAMTELFEGHTVKGSGVMGGRAEAWSCYRVHNDGFGRILVGVDDMSPHSLSRTVDRLVAIEDFYHLTLLALPLARAIKAELAKWETRVVDEMDALRIADSLEEKRAVLNSFLALAAEVEHLRARVSNRFQASAAYFSLLRNRFAELRETKIDHVFRLSGFVMRRLEPGAKTCQSVLDRLTNLSARIDRAAQLLETNVGLHVEEQNQRLLASADRRSRQQLEIQDAVEGLSVVAIAYYVAGLIGYVLKGARHLSASIDPDVTLAFAAPILVIGAWALMRLIRKRFRA